MVQTTLKRSGMDHTVLPATNTMPDLPRKRSPDGSSTRGDPLYLVLTQVFPTVGPPADKVFKVMSSKVKVTGTF